MTVTKTYFTTSEVAKMLGITRVTVFRKIKSGKIKAQKFGRNFMVPADQFIRNADLTEEKKGEIKKIVDKAVKEYGETFRLLGEE
ncbi:MAG: helix-turn-helix domain-containing protein [Patescibacteria group bacterium]